VAEKLRPAAGVLQKGTLRENVEVAPGVRLLNMSLAVGGDEVSLPVPGQFYLVECGGGREHLLRRPMSAAMAREIDGGLRLEFLVEVVGWGTAALAALAPGAEVDLLGPLGRGYDISGSRAALLIGGGIGVAPLYFLAKKLEAEGVTCELLAGFKTGERYFAGLSDLACAVTVSTEDGSLGACGLVCDGLEDRLVRFDSAFVCGPEAMMARATKACEKAGIPCQVSLDERMACGIGACRGCVREGAGGSNLCVCTDGPVFDSREVAWHA
jgi:dihydroorotate dehydrogenase electron transfer subunit